LVVEVDVFSFKLRPLYSPIKAFVSIDQEPRQPPEQTLVANRKKPCPVSNPGRPANMDEYGMYKLKFIPTTLIYVSSN
jgi:hypothetical protein